MRTHVRGLATLAGVQLIWLLAAAEPVSSIKTKDGRVITGEITGRLVLTEAPDVVVVHGKDIIRIDEEGVHVRPAAMVIFGGMSKLSNAEAYKSTTAIEVLRAVLPLAEKDKAEEPPENVSILRLALSGQGEGPGFGSTALRGGRAYFYKGQPSRPLKQPLIGELAEVGGVLSVRPVFKVMVGTSSTAIQVDSLASPNPQAK